MLSQSDIFNRLPISNEQKAQLYDALLKEQRDQTKEPNMVPCKFPKEPNIVPCEFPKVREKRSCDFPEISNCGLGSSGPDSLNDEPHTEPGCPGTSSGKRVEPIAHSRAGSPERDLVKGTEFVEHR